MSGEDYHPKTNCDVAVSRLHGTTSTIGIIAGLTLVAANERRLDENENHITAANTLESMEQIRRKSVRIPGAKPTTLAAFSHTKMSSPVSFSVQAPRETIERLQKHNKLLKQELSIEARAARELVGQEKRSQIEQIQSTLALFTRKLAKTQRQVKRTEQLMQEKTQELAALRLALQPNFKQEALAENDLGMPSRAYAAAAAASGRLRMAENRLELALVRKNEVDSANKHLLARVDAARRDRIIFDGIYKKLERETSGLKACHERAMSDFAHATQARDALAREVNRLEDAAEREQMEYETQFQELKRNIELWRKETGVCMTTSELQSLPSSTSDTSKRSDADVKQEEASSGPFRHVSAMSTWQIGVDLTLTSTPDALLTTYEQAFATIREQTGLQNIEILAQDLLARDTANFQRFKRVEELSREEVALQAQVAALMSQIETYKTHDGIASRISQKDQLRRLKALLSKTQQACDDLDAEVEERDAILTKIKASVHSVYNTMAHATASGSASGKATSLGHGISDTSVFESLQAIEMYTTALLQNKAGDRVSETSPAKTHKGDRGQLQPQAQTTDVSKASPLPLGHGPSSLSSDPSQQLHVHVPSFGGVDGYIDLPAEDLSHAFNTGRTLVKPPSKGHNFSVSKQQQQSQRLSTRDSLSLRQSFEALPLYGNEATVNSKRVDKKNTLRADKSVIAGGEELQDDEEEERVLTYNELKRLAVINTISQQRGTKPQF